MSSIVRMLDTAHIPYVPALRYEMIGMVKEANQEHLDCKLKEKALELFRRLEEISELPRFQGATVDFHQKKPATVFVPWIPTVAQVENGELLKFLKDNDVKKVLVDALWPTNAAILKQLVESGVEVWVLTRPSALHGWRKKHEGKPKGLVEWLERHHPEILEGFKTEVKNDVYDAVLLRYVKPKYQRRLTKEHLTCWVSMLLYRYARRNRQGLLQQLDALPVSEDERSWRVEMAEDYLMMEATNFIQIIKSCYPKICEMFKDLRIDGGDAIAQAFACDVFMEIDETKSLTEVYRKFGLIPKKDREGLIYDGVAKHSLVQLAAKRLGVNPKYLTADEKRAFVEEQRTTVEVIYKWKRKTMGLGPDASAGETRARALRNIKSPPPYGGEAYFRLISTGPGPKQPRSPRADNRSYPNPSLISSFLELCLVA